jgi:hypothetical protein
MPMFMVWHLRHQADPMHRWLRQQLEIVVAPALATRPGKAVHAVPGPGRSQQLNAL